MRLKKPLQNLALALALCATAAPALAQQQVKIGIGFGLAFLPIYICEDLKLIEKHAREAHLDVKASFPRFMGPGPLRDAIASGEIELAPFGTAPFLAAWEKGKRDAAPDLCRFRHHVAAARAAEQSAGRALDRRSQIHRSHRGADAVFAADVSAAAAIGKDIRPIRPAAKQVVALSHADAMSALIEGASQGAEHVTAYFSSPPFTELAFRDANLHPILHFVRSDERQGFVSGLGRDQGLHRGAARNCPRRSTRRSTKRRRIIRDDPRRAAQIYLTHEPSKTLDAARCEALAARDQGRIRQRGLWRPGRLPISSAGTVSSRSPPRSWKDDRGARATQFAEQVSGAAAGSDGSRMAALAGCRA